MEKSDIKINQQLLFIALNLVQANRYTSESDDFIERRLSKELAIHEHLSTIIDLLATSEGAAVGHRGAWGLFKGSLDLSDNHPFRNLWGANGQIVAVKPDNEEKISCSQPKNKIEINDIDIAKKASFWSPRPNQPYSFNLNAMRGVVYDENKELQIVNEAQFEDWLNSLGKRLEVIFKPAASVEMKIISLLAALTQRSAPEHLKVPARASESENEAGGSSETAGADDSKMDTPIIRILTGPPGTGKTTQAKLYATQDKTEIVQIHPSYSYEDLVEGIKPVTFFNGDLKYEVVDGPIRLMSRKALGEKVELLIALERTEGAVNIHLPIGTFAKYGFKDARIHIDGFTKNEAVLSDKIEITSEEALKQIKLGSPIRYSKASINENGWGAGPYTLILDELNRGNVASLLGELVFALSELDAEHGSAKSVRLQHSGQHFKWPRNLNLICTMNASDASTDRIDQAIKRRFEIVQVPVDYDILRTLRMRELNGLTISEFFAHHDLISVEPAALLLAINTALRQAKHHGAYNIEDKLIGQSYMIRFARRVAEEVNRGVSHKQAAKNQLEKLIFRELQPAILNLLNGDRSAQTAFFLKNFKMITDLVGLDSRSVEDKLAA